jgi:predicted Fe-Mo cluster-binding NifX family protein
MRLALATWNGRISPVLDVARQVLMLDVDDGHISTRHEEALPGTDLHAQAARLAALGPQVLICGAISRPMAAMLAGKGLRIIPFTAGTVEHVLAAWLAGRLPSLSLRMPGCCGRARHCRSNAAGKLSHPPDGCGGKRWGDACRRVGKNKETA